jgi:hypothetical protein
MSDHTLKPTQEETLEGVSELWICYPVWVSERNRITRVI